MRALFVFTENNKRLYKSGAIIKLNIKHCYKVLHVVRRYNDTKSLHRMY